MTRRVGAPLVSIAGDTDELAGGAVVALGKMVGLWARLVVGAAGDARVVGVGTAWVEVLVQPHATTMTNPIVTTATPRLRRSTPTRRFDTVGRGGAWPL